MIEWMMRGPSYGNCTCDWGCPCQFNKLPTHGHCRGLDAMRIDEGFYGDVRLDGLCWVNTFGWPGAVHEGNGEHQSIIDERANDEQREALDEILHGRAGVEGSSFLQIFASTMTTIHEPLYLPIEFECDIENCKARIVVAGMIDSVGKPMIDPFTGDAHRAKLVLPGGMEFTEAECGSGTTSATGQVKLEMEDSWGQFTTYHVTHEGVVH